MQLNGVNLDPIEGARLLLLTAAPLRKDPEKSWIQQQGKADNQWTKETLPTLIGND
jgi:hypothetical protein